MSTPFTPVITDPVRELQRVLSVREPDLILLRLEVKALRTLGYADNQIYRIALAGDPGLTPDTWKDLCLRSGLK